MELGCTYSGTDHVSITKLICNLDTGVQNIFRVYILFLKQLTIFG